MRVWWLSILPVALIASACHHDDPHLASFNAHFAIAASTNSSEEGVEAAWKWLEDPQNEAEPFLLAVLQKEKDDFRLATAASILGDMKDPRAFDLLIKALDSPHKLYCIAAVDALGQLGDQRAGKPILEDAQLGLLTKGIAIKALGNLKYKEAIPFILDALSSKRKYERLLSAEALAKFGDPKYKKDLIALKDDSNGMVLAGVALSIKKLDPQDPTPGQMIPGLISALQSDDVLDADDVIHALGKLGDKRAIKPLIDELSNEEAFLRKDAIEALAALKAKGALPQIEKMELDPSQGFRIAAAKAAKAITMSK